MKKLFTMLLFTALLSICRAALAEAYFRSSYLYHPYYHLSDRCALVVEPVAVKSGMDDLKPCPVCVPDASVYPGIEACERAGTVVIRIPDADIAEALSADTLPAFLPDELLHAADRQEEDLARLVHGETYLECLALTTGEEKVITAHIPELRLGDGDLLMSQRHLGDAWYFVLRQNEAARNAMAKSGALEVFVRFYSAKLRVHAWPAGLTLEDVGEAQCRDITLRLNPKPSANKVVARDEWRLGSDFELTVLQDRDVYTCVIHDRQSGSKGETTRWCRCPVDWTELHGYISEGESVYCLVLTEGEFALAQEYGAMHFDLVESSPLSRSLLEAAEPTHHPATSTTLANGSVVEMFQEAYPIGTSFVNYRQLRPAGGIAFFEANLYLERMVGDAWQGMGAVYAQAGPEPGPKGYCYSGWFCDEVQLMVRLEGVGALTEGLYRLRVSNGREGGGVAWLEFAVKEDAPQPEVPAAQAQQGETIAAHTARYALPGYNSCQDTTRREVNENRQLLLVGDTVFDLRRNHVNIPDITWDEWCYGSLFCYPLGHPEQARLVKENIPLFMADIYDGGDGLLLFSRDGEERLYQMDYSGQDLRELGRFLREDYQAIEELLPVGDVVYFGACEMELWRARRTDLASEKVGVDNQRKNFVYDPFTENYRPWRCLQYAEGMLLAANDHGILAIDTTATGGGELPAKRLTKAYDYNEAICGLGYIVLNGRLYCWSEEYGATISMTLDGSDIRAVSKEHFYFSGITSEGVVLAMTGYTGKGPFGGCETARLYFPDNCDAPAFDPDHCRTVTLPNGGDAFLFGDNVWYIPVDGSTEILVNLSEIRPD